MTTYDYVVVGAGSSGCVVASRLTEDPDIRVLLLEAGGPDDVAAIHDPRAFATLFKTPVDWAYSTEPEPELDGRSIFWPRGKVLGGTSAINAMVHIRGNRYDFDHWASLGNASWSYAEVLPHFLKSERCSRGASPFHGDAGPLAVTDAGAPHPYSLAFVEAAAELGYARNPDFNGERQEGAGLFQRTIEGGKRASAARAFLHPALGRPNLRALTHAAATRIVVQGGRAHAVRYVHAGAELEVRAREEVIVCAGAIESPKLLMLSGIGPADQLRALGIPIVADLPGVGANLQDHPLTRIRCWTSKHLPVDASSNLVEAGLFCSGPGSSNAPAPELYFHFLPVAAVETHHGGERSAFAIAAVLLRPESRGSLRLRSANPADAPLIHANYYAVPADRTRMREGLRIARALSRTSALAALVVEEALPGPGVASDRELEVYIRQTSDTIFHPVGTCKMGVDPLAVVDPLLRVHGIEALRIIDASIMPTITTGNTNAPAIMIGEKGVQAVLTARK